MKLTQRQRQVLEAGPFALTQSASSADIAESLHEETHWIASTLKALEAKGLIICTKRGGRGLPSRFRTTHLGRSVLQEAKDE